MSNEGTSSAAPTSFFATPWVGTLFTVLSGLSFLLTCMFLPLVGKAGSVVSHARENFYTFLAVLLVSLVTATLATVSKLERRKIDGSPLPHFSFLLIGLCLLLLIALFTGLLAI